MKRAFTSFFSLFLSALLVSAASAQEVDTVTLSNGHPVATYTTDQNVLNLESQMLELINNHRLSIGRNAFIDDANLRMIARAKSKHMHVHDFFAHQSPEGDSGSDSIADAGLTVSGFQGEILQRHTGGADVQYAFDSWMASSGHRTVIEYPDFRYAGPGYSQGSTWSGSAEFTQFWSMEAVWNYSGSVPIPPPSYTDLSARAYGMRNRHFDPMLEQQVLVTNSGGYAPSSRLRIYASTDRFYSSNDELLSSYSVPALSNGETFLIRHVATIPSNFPKISYILIRVDVDGEVSETNEGNNLVATQVGSSKNPYDISGDGVVNLFDDIVGVILVATTRPGDYNWNGQCDFHNDGFIYLDDILAVASHYGESEAGY